MSVSEQDIRQAYAAHAVPGSSCLDAGDLEAFYSEQLRGADADRVRAHLAVCPACLDVARDYLAFSRTPRRVRSRVTWPLGLAAAATLAVFVGGAIWRVGSPSPPAATIRGIESDAGPVVIGPSGDLERPPRVLEWRAVESADHYEVEIQDIFFRVVWRVARVDGTRVLVPEDIAVQLRDGSFGWRVTAVMGDGRRVASSFESFQVRAQP